MTLDVFGYVRNYNQFVALLTDGSPLIPAFLIAITKGDDAAVPPSKFKPLAFEGTKIPMMKVPRI